MMRQALICTWILSLSACAYVSKDELLAEADADGDGWTVEEDCDDNNAEIYPFAPDLRGDGCDSDCGTTPDADGDDWPDSADCDANDPAVYPWAPEADGDGVDHDCDGHDGPREDASVRTDPAHPTVTSVECGSEPS